MAIIRTYGGKSVAKTEWGVKRTCLACSTRFYDMRKDPIICPNCGAKFDIETIFRPKRTRASADEQAPKPAIQESESSEDIEKQLAALADESIEETEDADDDDTTIEIEDDEEDEAAEVVIVPKDFKNEET